MSNWRQLMPTPEAYTLDKVLYTLHHAAGDLAQYLRDPDDYLQRFSLTPRLKALIVDNDVAGLYLAGVNPYILRAHCIGVRIPEAVSLAALRSAAQEANNG